MMRKVLLLKHAWLQLLHGHGIDGEVAPHRVLFSRGRSNVWNSRIVRVSFRSQVDKVEGHDGVGWHIVACDSDANGGSFQVFGLFSGSLDDADAAATRRLSDIVKPQLELSGKLLAAVLVDANINVVIVALQQLVSDPAATNTHGAPHIA